MDWKELAPESGAQRDEGSSTGEKETTNRNNLKHHPLNPPRSIPNNHHIPVFLFIFSFKMAGVIALGGSGENGGVRIVVAAPRGSLKPPPPTSSLHPTAGKGGGMHKRGRDRSLSSPPSLIPPLIGVTHVEEVRTKGSQGAAADLEPVDLDGDSDDGSLGKKRGKKKQDRAKERRSFDLPRVQISSSSSSIENEKKARAYCHSYCSLICVSDGNMGF
jgi:hypothetical protein